MASFPRRALLKELQRGGKHFVLEGVLFRLIVTVEQSIHSTEPFPCLTFHEHASADDGHLPFFFPIVRDELCPTGSVARSLDRHRLREKYVAVL